MSSLPIEPAAPRSNRWFFLLPALTFLIGLLLGGVLVAVTGMGDNGSDDDRAQATDAPTTPDPQASASDLTVTIPGSCVDAAELSEDVLDLADRAAAALRDLDAGELPSLIADMEALSAQVREAADRCREEAATASGSG